MLDEARPAAVEAPDHAEHPGRYSRARSSVMARATSVPGWADAP
jgi:hypothetical protein